MLFQPRQPPFLSVPSVVLSSSPDPLFYSFRSPLLRVLNRSYMHACTGDPGSCGTIPKKMKLQMPVDEFRVFLNCRIKLV